MSDEAQSGGEGLTYKQIAEHNNKDDIYVVIHDVVYDTTAWIDEHPGGEEVLLDVAGQDATEAFEDVGHSDEARETLQTLRVGPLKRQPGDPQPASSMQQTQKVGTDSGSGLGGNLFSIILVGIIAALAVYQYLQSAK